jgi:PleD family two-component response regulator
MPSSFLLPLMTTLMHEQITVLLIDDQSIVCEAIRRMLASEQDIVFHYCSDPTQAFDFAEEYQPQSYCKTCYAPNGRLAVSRFLRSKDTFTCNIP